MLKMTKATASLIALNNHTADALHARLAHVGLTPAMARRIISSALCKNALPRPDPNIATRVLEAIRPLTFIPHLTREARIKSATDGFTRYTFQGAGPERFEAVRIPLLHKPGAHKAIVCVSSQAGCALGCVFCMTGKMGFNRNLEAWEIVDQVVHVQADSPEPVRGVVFMGMGEPLLNLDAVLDAARILSAPYGLAIPGKSITLSTAGITPGIRRLTAMRAPFRLIVSLTSADPATRAKLMPVEQQYPTSELMSTLREYHKVMRRRVTLAWTLISGINTRAEDARQLAELVRDLPVQLDLIDVNDPTGHFRPPSDKERNAFRDELRAVLPAPVKRRYSGGQDINAACGMLAGSEQ